MPRFLKIVDCLRKILESENNCAVEWFDGNKMIVNPDKFQAIQLEKRQSDLTDQNIKKGSRISK